MSENVKRVKASGAAAEQVRPMPLVKLPKKLHTRLEDWLRKTVPMCKKKRDGNQHRREKWRETLRGKRTEVSVSRDASNMSVPFSIWAASSMRARQIEGIFNIPPFLSAKPLGRLKGGDPQQGLLLSKSMQTWLESEIRNPRGLAGKAAGEKVITEKTNYGTSGLKVYVEPDQVYEAPDGEGEIIIRGRPKWEYISYDDLIYWDGYGTDTQTMPFVGHEFMRTWSDMLTWVELGYYDRKAVTEVKKFYADNKEGQDAPAPVTVMEHPIIELYLNYPTKIRTGDDGAETVGLPAPLVIDWHVKAEKILRVTRNTNPRGQRPIFVDQYDGNPDPKCLAGQGVCEKLEGAQDETDAIHNIGIEAGKLAAAHLIVLKQGSQAEKELGGGDPIMPGDVASTEDPSEDIVAVPLGDPNAAATAVQLEEHTRMYIMRMFGLDEGSQGDTTAGKRVPASLGLSLQREGQIPTTHSLARSSDMYTDAIYLTIDLYKQVLPEASLIAAVGDEQATLLYDTVFSLGNVESRDQFVITVNAKDAATVHEQRKNELMMLTQFLFGFFDKLVQMGTLMLQVPEQFQPVIQEIIVKIENSVRLLLSSVESVQNPEEVIPEVSEMLRELVQLSDAVAGSGGAPAPGPAALEAGEVSGG